jgi:Zn-dependent protease
MPSLQFILTLAVIFAAIKLLPILSAWQNLMNLRMRYRPPTLTDEETSFTAFATVFKLAADVLEHQGFVFSHNIVRPDILTDIEKGYRVYFHPKMFAYAYVEPRDSFHKPFPYQISYVTHFSDGKTVWTTDWEADVAMDLPPNQSVSDGFFGDTDAQWDLHQKSVERHRSSSWAQPLSLSPAEELEIQSRLLTENVIHWEEKYLRDGDEGSYRYRPRVAWELASVFMKANKTRSARFGQAREIPTESVEANVEADVGVMESLFMIENSRGRKSSQKLWLLLASAVAFGVVFGAFSSWESVPLILLILLIHEAGHWGGMKAFGYRDTRIYFIPFFGAITMGKNEDATPLQKLTVFLLGPMPGILIGMAATMVYVITSQPAWLKIGAMFLVINYLNLLPVSPLDGGRIVETLIQRRYPRAVVYLTIASGVVLCCFALLLKETIFGFLGIVMLLSVPRSWRLSKSIRALQSTMSEAKEKHEILTEIVRYSYRPATAGKNPDGRLGLVKPLFAHFTSPSPSRSHAVKGFAIYLVALASPLIFAFVVVMTVVVGRIAGSSFASGNWEQRIAEARSARPKLDVMLEAASWYEDDREHPDSALHYYRRALTLADSANIRDYPYLQTLLGLARLDRDSARVNEYLASALTSAESLYGLNHDHVAEVLEHYGDADPTVVTDEVRIPSLERAIRIRSAMNDMLRTSSLQRELAHVFERRRQTARAESLFIQSVYSLEQTKYYQVPAIHALASFHERMAQHSLALSVLRTWETQNQEWLKENCMVRVELSAHRGWIALRANDTSRARLEFKSGLELLIREGLSSSYVIAPVAMDLCYLETSVGNYDSASSVFRWVSERIPSGAMRQMFDGDSASVAYPDANSINDWETVRHRAHMSVFKALRSTKQSP